MNARPLLAGLALAAAAQWAVPAYLVYRGQTTLAEGTSYRFRTAPVDPVDPFRGRYVVLDFEAARLAVPAGTHDFEPGQRVYAPIAVDEQGYATLGVPSPRPPDGGDYLQVRIQWVGDGELRLRLPFDRYYLDERLAPEAERRSQAGRGPRRGAPDEDHRQPAHVSVRVRDGYAVIEELYIDGQPVHALLRGEAPRQR